MNGPAVFGFDFEFFRGFVRTLKLYSYGSYRDDLEKNEFFERKVEKKHFFYWTKVEECPEIMKNVNKP